MDALLTRLKKAKADAQNLMHREKGEKEEKKRDDVEPQSSRSVRAKKKTRRPTAIKAVADPKEIEKEKAKPKVKGSVEEGKSVRQKKAKKINLKKRTRHKTTTEEGVLEEEEKKEEASEKRKDYPMILGASNERVNVAELVKAQMTAGAIDASGEDVKTAMRNFALRSSSLLGPGALQEYVQTVKMFIPEDTTREAFDKNPSKNRYKDVVCADRERVILKGDCDYIHANHVRGSPLPECQHFICTQGPMQTTVTDFWRMCRQENTSAIIMLCETKEQGKDKCHQYWGEKEGETLKIDGSDITVTTKGRFSHDGSGLVTSLLVVKEKGDAQDQQILHHQWKTWPDKGVPENFETVLKLLQLVRKSDPKTSCVVHCSAGIGRTGTLVAVEMCIQRLLQGRPLEVLSIVKQLRAKRMHCVQTDLQYVFVYRVLIGFLSTRDPDAETKLAIEEFVTSYNNLIASRQQPMEAYAPITFGPGI